MSIQHINPTEYRIADALAAGTKFEGWSVADGYVVSDPPPEHVHGSAYMAALFDAMREAYGTQDECLIEGDGDHDYLAELTGEAA